MCRDVAVFRWNHQPHPMSCLKLIIIQPIASELILISHKQSGCFCRTFFTYVWFHLTAGSQPLYLLEKYQPGTETSELLVIPRNSGKAIVSKWQKWSTISKAAMRPTATTKELLELLITLWGYHGDNMGTI